MLILKLFSYSKSCRAAIKFGQSLSPETCEELVRDLGSCRAPFQCAHGVRFDRFKPKFNLFVAFKSF